MEVVEFILVLTLRQMLSKLGAYFDIKMFYQERYIIILPRKIHYYFYPHFQADAFTRPIIIHLSLLIFAEYSVFR